MIKKQLKFISSISIIMPALLYHLYGELLFAAQRPDALPVKVVAVHDGDTVSIIVNGMKERVRLIGIDAPELGQGLWGIKSKRHLEELLHRYGRTVTLELDVEKRDKYGRLLAYLWTQDGRLINLDMIRDGYAVLFTFPPNVRYVEILRKAERFAREKGLGIWEKNGLKELPEDYKRKHPRL